MGLAAWLYSVVSTELSIGFHLKEIMRIICESMPVRLEQYPNHFLQS